MKYTGSLLLAASALLLAGCPMEEPAPIAKPVAMAPTASPTGTVAISHRDFASLKPVDVEPLRMDWTPEQLAGVCEEAEKTADNRLAAIASIPDEQRTFANTILAIELAEWDYQTIVSRASFMKDIHPEEKVRAAASACEQKSGEYAVTLGSRKDLFLATRGYLEHAGKTDNLDAQDKRLIEFAMRDFHRSGLDLSESDRAKLVEMRKRLADLQTQYSTHLDEDQSSITATKSELAGLPGEFVKRLKKGKDGRYILTTKYPDYYPVMENAKNAELRRRMQVAFGSRGASANIALENEAITLRDHAAHLLGYPTHADYVTETVMAKTAKTAIDFESRLREELKPRLQADTRKMEALKSADTHGRDKTIHSWDWRYYLNQIKKSDFALDDEVVRAYFPADRVMDGMFQVYQTLFSITFQEVPIASPWAEGVKQYEIHDVPSGRLLGRFYVDLYPRPGKYGHAASFDITHAHEVDAGYAIPLSALVVNFNPPSAGQAARLSVDEVDTLFHEFGHIMHMSLTTARYASLSGSNVARDFVEAPSQMLENWVFEPEILKLISRDPSDPSKTMPADLMKKVVATRTFDSGVKYTRQVFLGTFDLRIHTQGDQVDTDRECRNAWEELMGFPEDPGEHFSASFNHLMGGYDAGYYGYLWSLVFAADMFTRFQKEGVLNPKTGRDYRDTILAKGRTEDPDQLLREFLGREPNEEAFLKLAGIKSS